jgi:hypothetical protein
MKIGSPLGKEEKIFLTVVITMVAIIYFALNSIF